MTSAEDKASDAPVKPKRILPRRGKWPAAAGAARRETPETAREANRAKPQPASRRPNPASELWAKAEVAVRSARVLLETGDLDGAGNRAYYAVFGGARAALARVRGSHADSKGHSTIVRRFEKHIVQARGLDPAFGHAFFARLSHVRWVSDYSRERAQEPAVRAAVGEAERFIAAVEPFLRRAKP